VQKPSVAFSVRITGKRRSSTAQNAGYEVTERLLSGLRDHFGPQDE
jgi:hypothetical protein